MHTGRVPQDPGAPDPLLDPPSWAPSWLPGADDLHRHALLRWVVLGVLVAGLGACVLRGADSPADPELETPGSEIPVSQPPGSPTTGSQTTGSVVPAGTSLAVRFGSVLVDLVTATGELVELCLLHADTSDERIAGLREVTDLEGFHGMLFTQPEPAAATFVMTDTPLPLTLAWFDETGAYVGGTDMDPCAGPDCPTYPTPPILHAIEFPRSGLGTAALAEGTTMRLGDSCTPEG